MNVFIVSLVFNINFDDADYGLTYAGESSKILRCYSDVNVANDFIKEITPIILAAEKETISFPIQPNNQKLKNILGFTLDEFNDADNFRLVIKEMNVFDKR